MAIKKVSKAIAGAVVGAVAAQVDHLTGMTLPVEAMEWASAALASVIGAAIGYVIVYFSPKNEPS